MAVFDAGVDLPGQQIYARKQAERAVALVFVVAREPFVRSRLWWQVRRRVADRLNARLLVVGDDRDVARYGLTAGPSR